MAGAGRTRPRGYYGLAEHIAAEEMGRLAGVLVGPGRPALLVARVDETPVTRWYISDPAHPDRTPAEIRYPAAGTPNADVSLVLVGLDGSLTPVEWDRDAFEYLVTVAGRRAAPEPLIVVQNRDQSQMQLRTVDPDTGATSLLREDTDPQLGGHRAGRTGLDRGRAARLERRRPRGQAAGGGHPGRGSTGGRPKPVTPGSLQVRDIIGVDADTVLFTASG